MTQTCNIWIYVLTFQCTDQNQNEISQFLFSQLLRWNITLFLGHLDCVTGIIDSLESKVILGGMFAC